MKYLALTKVRFKDDNGSHESYFSGLEGLKIEHLFARTTVDFSDCGGLAENFGWRPFVGRFGTFVLELSRFLQDFLER